MDQKPQSSASRSVRRMDGLGSSASQRKANAPLDLRNSPEPAAKPQEPVAIPSASTPVISRKPILPPSKPAPVEEPQRPASNYDDPLQDLLHEEPAVASQPAAPAPAPAPAAPKKKRGFWKKLWRFIAVLLIILFVVSAGVFVYLNYYQVQ